VYELGSGGNLCQTVEVSRAQIKGKELPVSRKRPKPGILQVDGPVVFHRLSGTVVHHMMAKNSSAPVVNVDGVESRKPDVTCGIFEERTLAVFPCEAIRLCKIGEKDLCPSKRFSPLTELIHTKPRLSL
jgi:hypothetical protein